MSDFKRVNIRQPKRGLARPAGSIILSWYLVRKTSVTTTSDFMVLLKITWSTKMTFSLSISVVIPSCLYFIMFRSNSNKYSWFIKVSNWLDMFYENKISFHIITNWQLGNIWDVWHCIWLSCSLQTEHSKVLIFSQCS